ncbi:MAG: hypothetical protein NC416_16680 [Eubacterium sp.]|nr:hypothetical protein [Eubacterium sp.]
MRWIPLQSMASRKWKLCVIFDDCATYDVTTIESDHVAEILRYAVYMNENNDEGIETGILEKLDRLKQKYGSD